MHRTVFHSLLLALCTAAVAQAAAVDRPFSLTPESAVKALAAAAPVSDEPTTFQGGQTVALRGLFASDAVAANLALVNRSQATNRCTLALATADGVGLGPVISLTLGPGETRPFVDAFRGRVSDLTETRAAVSCQQAFYAYAQVADGDTGRLDVVAPEPSAEALTLAKDDVPCPATSCFDAPGIDHIPQPPPGLPVGRVSFPAPSITAKRLRLTIDVKVGDWFPDDPSGKHLIYWFVVDKNIDMPGLLYFLGPNKDEAFARHGINLKHPQKIKVIKPFTAQVGHTYHVDNDYDMAHGKYTVTVTDAETGQVAVVLKSRPNVKSYTIKPGLDFLVDMGFYPGAVDGEVPSYDWEYSNVHVEVYQ
ncbi:MAG: hypothetical protein DMF53_18440 [Acidobacteria bacterium]|nr:MAG: hypothetical protein DMF53_18440 [Acidobacteriota bacterium]